MYVDSVIIETLKSAQIASVVPIFIKDLVVVYLASCHYEKYKKKKKGYRIKDGEIGEEVHA